MMRLFRLLALLVALLPWAEAHSGYTLKSNTLADKVVNLIIVDDDNTTVVDIGNTPSTPVADANVTIQDMDWNSVTRKAFQTDNQGAFNFYGITFSANPPPLNHGSGDGGNTTVIVMARGPSNGVSYSYSAGASNAFGLRFASGAPTASNQSNSYSVSETFTATDFSERIIVAITHEYGAVRQIFSDVDGGTDTAFEVDTTDAGFGATDTVDGIGGWAGQGYQESRVLAFINFDSKLSLSEIQSLRDDWFGELVDSGGGAGTSQIRALQNLSGGFGPHESQELNGVIQHD